VLGKGFLLVADPDPASFHRFLDEHPLAGIAVGDRVAVTPIADQAVLGYLSILHIAGVIIGLACDRGQPFPHQPLVGHFAGRTVRPVVDFFQPQPRLPVPIC
jgi:hypothetical protein